MARNPFFMLKFMALLCGSALFLYGCSPQKKSKAKDEDPILPTLISDSLTITSYNSGKTEYRFWTPKLIRYENSDTSYMLFEKGIRVKTFRDSTLEPYTWLTAKWALYKDMEGLWEVRDSVVAHDREGKTLYTDLLYWDEKQERIYSPIETKVVSGTESTIGKNGFESDQEMTNVVFRNASGTFAIDTMNTPPPDTTAAGASPAV